LFEMLGLSSHIRIEDTEEGALDVMGRI
jgi:hypothetical protein